MGDFSGTDSDCSSPDVLTVYTAKGPSLSRQAALHSTEPVPKDRAEGTGKLKAGIQASSGSSVCG